MYDYTVDDRCYTKELNGQTLVFVAIPKCGSTMFDQTSFRQKTENTTKTKFRQFGDYPNFKNKKFIVTLREPVSRWISGASEYLARNNPTMENWDPLELVWDPHTIPQIDHWFEIPVHMIEWHILEDAQWADNLNNAYKLWRNGVHAYNSNSIDTKQEWKKEIRQTVKVEYLRNKELQEKIKVYYEQDFKIYNAIKNIIDTTGNRTVQKYPIEINYAKNPLFAYN